MMNKNMALICLALAAPLASAAGSPQTMLEGYLAKDAAGMRLKEYPGARYFANYQDEPGWDMVTLITGYGVQPQQCGPRRCEFVVRYQLDPTRPSDEQAKPHPKGGEEKARYVVVKQGGGWKIDSGSMREPHVKRGALR
ncbi:hypothetical protein [Pseudogulbenkiania ferrooxidans]|nr:hypothetical protein [Pseudogulbenkiania ferrooxidans]